METGIISLYSEVKTTPINWLWYPFFAIGKISLLQGDPGDGKSTMMLRLIAEISNGGTTPDGQSLVRPQRVLYQCSEDGVADTIKPMLEVCGADCRNIAFINEEIYGGLTLDDERLRQAIIEFRPRLVVIDPIQAYIGSDSDLQITGRARKTFTPNFKNHKSVKNRESASRSKSVTITRESYPARFLRQRIGNSICALENRTGDIQS